MTDQRLPRDSYLGHAGRLSLKPLELATKAEDCGWQSSRDFSQNGFSIKRLSTAGPEEAAETGNALQHESGDTWQISKKQETWLLRNHPEARLGDSGATHQLLGQVLSGRNGLLGDPTSGHMVAVGEMIDYSEPHTPRSVPFLARVVGEGQNVIRLTVASHERWQCSAAKNITLLPAGLHDSISLDWSEVIGPVRSLKCIVDSKPYEPVRALIAQWDTETRLFLPEIEKAYLVSESRADPVLSRITANCALRIPRDRTGGGNHSDISFNPGNKSRPPQLALIDDQGCWTVWDMPKAKTSRKTRAHLNRCGDMEQGTLKCLYVVASSRPCRHTITWVGPANDAMNDLDDSDYEDDTKTGPPVFPHLPRSTSLLMCNAKAAKLFDLNTDSFIPGLHFTSTEPSDLIVEAQVHPDDPSYIFLLTTRALFLLRLTSTIGHDFTKPEKSWFILSSIAHFRSPFSQSLRISVTSAPKPDGKKAFLVLLYSQGSKWMDLLCMSAEKRDPSKITWRRETMSCVPGVQSAWLQPVAVELDDTQSHNVLGQRFVDAQDRFYQLFQAQDNGNVQQSLYMVSINISPGKALPSFFGLETMSRQVKRTTKSSRRVATRFVVQDSEALLQGSTTLAAYPSALQEDLEWLPPFRFLGSSLHQLTRYTRGSSSMQTRPSAADHEFESNPFDLAHRIIEDAAAVNSLPASTVLELLKDFDTPLDMSEANDDWNTEIELLRRSDSRLSTLTLHRPDSTLGTPTSLQEVAYRLERLMSHGDVIDEEGRWTDDGRLNVLRLVACDLYLSSIGFVLDIPDVEYSQGSAAPPPNSSLDLGFQNSSQLSAYSQAVPGSSQNLGYHQEEDPAMKLIRSYTGSGRFIPKRDTELGSLWETGTNPHEYVFDVDKEKEVTGGMKRRERELAKASRKRQRAQALRQLQARGEHDNISATQPAPEISFVQSSPVRQHSSQNVSQGFSQPIAMSQPITGPFAQRPKKKAKRKGGF